MEVITRQQADTVTLVIPILESILKGVILCPPKGVIHYAPNGDAICHICGEAQRKLGSHIARRHHMSQNEYRDMFELYHNTKLSNYEYIKNMSRINNKYRDIVVKENLIKRGEKTRITHENGLSGRKFQHKVSKKILENL